LPMLWRRRSGTRGRWRRRGGGGSKRSSYLDDCF
jgi:hypothetical protein